MVGIGNKGLHTELAEVRNIDPFYISFGRHRHKGGRLNITVRCF